MFLEDCKISFDFWVCLFDKNYDTWIFKVDILAWFFLHKSNTNPAWHKYSSISSGSQISKKVAWLQDYHSYTKDILGGDCSGLGGDKRPGDLGGLSSPQTVSNSSVILVYSVCMCIKIDDLGLMLWVEVLGGKTFIFGSAKVTFRSRVPSRGGGNPDAEGGGSDVSGSDWVWENCRRGKFTLAGWGGSSPTQVYMSETIRIFSISTQLYIVESKYKINVTVTVHSV